MPAINNDKRCPIKFALGEKIRYLQENDPEELKKMLMALSPEEAAEIQYDDEIMLRDKQWVPLDDPLADIILICAGRGFGKTHALAATIKRAVEKHAITQMMIIAPTARTLNRTIAPAIMARYPMHHPNRPELRQGFMRWPNGAELLMIPAEAGEDAPRSANVELLFLEEAAFYDNNEGIITQAELTCRLPPAKTIVATTPKATETMIDWVSRYESGDESIRLINGSTMENKLNLSKKFTNTVIAKYKGTRMEATELEGKLILSNEDALFQMDEISRYEIKDRKLLPNFVKYSIGVDPAINSKQSKSSVGKKRGRKPDAVGIVVSALGDDGMLYTLEDHTKRYGSGAAWNKRVADLYDFYRAKGKTHIVMEVNAIGLDYIKTGFRDIDRADVGDVIEGTFSTENKLTRLQPFALKHDQGFIRWYNPDNRLENLFREITTFTGSGASPNSMDAFVFSMMPLAPIKKKFVEEFELTM
jgi:phage terminase large subunit-like protein